MRNAIRLYSGLTVWFFTLGLATADTVNSVNPSAGLWVGEVILSGVNETVNGVNANNQVVSPDPAKTTPVHNPAHIRVIMLVDSNGVASLLKSVAMVSTATLSTNIIDTNTLATAVTTNSQVILLTDPTTYAQYGTLPGQRLTAVGYDFGDGPAAQNALDALALAVANAAVGGQDATNAANALIQNYINTIPANATPGYSNFIQSATFTGLGKNAAIAAVSALATVNATVATSRKIEIAQLAVVSNLKSAGAYTAADGLTLYQLPLTGQLAPGAEVTGTIYLGADHPTNPYRHKWNPIELHGYAITRKLKIDFDAASGTDATAAPGFGVNYITGHYQESIFGLHKPLGPNQDIGLITDGTLRLDHVFNQ